MHFNMSSAICFNLDHCKILSSGNALKSACQDFEYFDFLVVMLDKSKQHLYANEL